MEPLRTFFFYEDEKGYSPVSADITGLPGKEASKIDLFLNELRFVSPLGMPYYKPFAGYGFNFGELRIGSFRIFVSWVDTNRYLMLHVFRKQSNDTPKQEINRALKRLEEWKSRNPS